MRVSEGIVCVLLLCHTASLKRSLTCHHGEQLEHITQRICWPWLMWVCELHNVGRFEPNVWWLLYVHQKKQLIKSYKHISSQFSEDPHQPGDSWGRPWDSWPTFSKDMTSEESWDTIPFSLTLDPWTHRRQPKTHLIQLTNPSKSQ